MPKTICLVADVGGTKTRLALLQPGDPPGDAIVLRNEQYDGLGALTQAYLEQARPASRPTAAAYCVACPVEGDTFTLTNRDWTTSISRLREELGVGQLEVVNDFTAIAMSVPYLTAEDVEQVGGGQAKPQGAIGVIGPGTGLGVSGVVSAGQQWVPLHSEGGHITMPQRTDREAAVAAWIRKRHGNASAERAVSGPGLVNLYEALCAADGHTSAHLQPREIAARAAEGDDDTCVEATRMFASILGTVAGDLALTIGAKGGVYVGGGVIWNMDEAFDRNIFRAAFDAKGRLSSFVTPIPIYLIKHRWPALVGLSHLLAGDVALGA